jgi:hypothetical protein
MYRVALALVLSLPAAAVFGAGACSVAGKAYDNGGRPLHNAVLRLVDLQTRQTAFRAADANANFVFEGLDADGSGRYRIDVLGPATVVTGSKIPTRSIVGMTRGFSCSAGELAHQDVHAQVY